MRIIKLAGRECSILHAIGFTESTLGTEIQDFTRIEADGNGIRSERSLRPRLKERGFAVLRRAPAF
jgi:hypothetical protein